MREIFSMNEDWRFLQEDLEERNFDCIHQRFFQAPEWIKAGNHGVSKVGYPDQNWELVSLPHDFLQSNGFSADAPISHGCIPKGVAWYRKTFEIPAEDEGRSIYVEFDGVYRDSSVWVNGSFIGRHLSGYTSFSFDISDVLNYGGVNSIAVRADATLAELWSYEGGGIYRDVRLVKTDAVHVNYLGTFVYTETAENGIENVFIETRIKNDSLKNVNCEVRSTILDAEGKSLAETTNSLAVALDETADLKQTTTLENPTRWHTDNPYLHVLKTEILIDGTVVDEYTTTFGIRSFVFDPEKGFFLNGESMKLRGVCNHQDHAGVGTGITDSLQEWRMLQMKEMGINALRVSHNPPTPALLDICDRLGIMVMNEGRLTGSSNEIMQQYEDLMRRDRNHPSVIMWSLGNEEMGIQATTVGVKQLRKMHNLSKKLDPSRATTYSMNCIWVDIADLYEEHDFKFDVFGANYTYVGDNKGVDDTQYDTFHEKFPTWPLIGSETGGSFATRGLYDIEFYDGKPLELNEFGHGGICWEGEYLKGTACAYNNGLTPWGAPIDVTWKSCADRDFMAGTFVWTGFDYRGETYPYDWPAVVTRFGLMDLCGFPKDAYFYYKSWWNPEPMVHVFPHWNWAGKEGKTIKARAYSNCAEVEFVVNGESVARLAVEKNSYVETMVVYQPGKLEAIGYDENGVEITRMVNETVGKPAAIRVIADRETLMADGQDTAVCRVEIVDSEGRLVPTSDNEIRFTVEGAGKLAGVGNGNPTSHEAPKGKTQKAYFGLCQALIQTSLNAGKITLKAESDGLETCEIELSTEAVKLAIIPSVLSEVETIAISANPVDGIL